METSTAPMATADHRSPDDYAASFSLLADAVGRFVDAWESRSGEPRIGDHLPESPTLRRLLLVELIKVDLEYRWLHGGEPKRVADYLGEFPELTDFPPIELLYEEFHLRKQAGLNVDPGEYAREYPQHADTLCQWIGPGVEYQSTVITKPADQRLLDGVEPGQTIDDFDLVLELGRGAFARVFLARQRSMQRLVALKVSANRGTEPQTLAQLDHDAIVRVFDQHTVPETGLRLLYMQFLAGGTLQSTVNRVRSNDLRTATGRLLLDGVDEALESRGNVRPTESPLRRKLQKLTWPETVAWLGARLADGLDYAHGRGVLHRDIKPANVLLTSEGAPKLADFNISFSDSVEGSTPAAYFGGSLGYMSPEQLEAAHPARARQVDELDGRSDVYSLGVMLWELLTGRRPFDDRPMQGGWAAAVEGMVDDRLAGVDAARIRQSGIECPATLTRILMKCLAAERDHRWDSGRELAGQLDLCLDQRARDLLDPPSQSWEIRLRPWAVWIVLLANLIPNGFGAVFNFLYVKRTIVPHLLPATQARFDTMAALVNGTAFPIGIALIVWLAYRVLRGLGRLETGSSVSREQATSLRQECLRLGERCAMICVALWTIAGISYPLSMRLQSLEVGRSDAVHWAASLAVSGLIAVAYPFFGVTYFAVRSIYPGFLHHQAPGLADHDELARLKSRLGVYLVVAASVPLLAIGGLTMAAAGPTSGTGAIIGFLCVGGIVGLAVVYFVFFRNLQTDLDALSRVVRSGSSLTE
ncbi:MAG: protein kinase [Planctomycetaceae bacterium]